MLRIFSSLLLLSWKLASNLNVTTAMITTWNLGRQIIGDMEGSNGNHRPAKNSKIKVIGSKERSRSFRRYG